MMNDDSSEEEHEEFFRSDPWKWRHLQIIEPRWITWVLTSPSFSCIPQLDFLEYSVVEKYETKETTQVMKVHTKVNGIEKLAILKLYQVRARYRDTRLDGFALELVAYSNLTHHGFCDEGLVPHCYGWYDFASELQDGAAVQVRRHPSMWEDELPPRALLLEYIEDAVPISAENYTPQMAPAVIEALDRIHSIGIIHKDIRTLNILVRPDGKTIWIDFESAHTFPPEVMDAQWIIFRSTLEMSHIWSIMNYKLPREQRRLLRHHKYQSDHDI
ncbi:hypothetical protein BU17DRAFT_96421 [Hysterangium stoloniferum]|nr:hypothetical protein BU17DRAFT_96421 [Hysterangium stoloniferum]